MLDLIIHLSMVISIPNREKWVKVVSIPYEKIGIVSISEYAPTKWIYNIFHKVLNNIYKRYTYIKNPIINIGGVSLGELWRLSKLSVCSIGI